METMEFLWSETTVCSLYCATSVMGVCILWWSCYLYYLSLRIL